MEIEAVQELEMETEKVGPQGYSAYEVAVQNGFEGTEEEWLESLKGADGTDGATGPQGLPGADGQDGADATINGVSAINIVAGENITLDQEDGTLTINSTGGGTRDYTALTNKPSINNVTLSGNKSLSDLGAGTYDKPASGIPKTDLASDVQASLSKADTALQTHQDISGKQDVLTAGDNITIANNVISASGVKVVDATDIEEFKNAFDEIIESGATGSLYMANFGPFEDYNGYVVFLPTSDTTAVCTYNDVKIEVSFEEDGEGGYEVTYGDEVHFATSTDLLDKQDVLTAGTNITIDENNVISASGGGEVEVQALRSIAGLNGNTKFHYYVIAFDASGQPTLGNLMLKPAIINIMNDYIEHFDSNYTYNHIIIEIKTSLNNLDCTAKIENWGSSAQMNSSQAYVIYPGYYTRETLRFTYSDGICTDYTSTILVYATTNDSFPILKNNIYAYTPTTDYHPATKKYVDDAVAGAAGGNAFPTYTIDLDTIIYANGLVLSATDNAKFSNAFTDAYSKGYKSIQILINYRTNQSESQYVYQNLMLPGGINGATNVIDITTKPRGYSFQSVINNNGELTFPGDKTQMSIMFSTLSLTLNWSGDVCSVTNARHYQTSYVFPLLSGVLYKTNTMAYTPMSNYHPATKLYTDLSVVKASGLLPYATNKTYQLGDYIYRSATDPTLYKCKVATTSGNWVAANWEQKTYMEYLSDTLVGGALNGSY